MWSFEGVTILSVVDAIFPISAQHAKKIFDDKKDVFVKYTNFSKLTRNSKIIFYVSGEKLLFGEAKIEKVISLEPNAVWAKFSERLFLNEEELNEYSSNSPIERTYRKKRLMTVFELKNLKKYGKKISFPFGITAAGRYVTIEEYNRMLG